MPDKVHFCTGNMFTLHLITTNNHSLRIIVCINTGNKKQLFTNCSVASHPESYKLVVNGRSSDLSLSGSLPVFYYSGLELPKF